LGTSYAAKGEYDKAIESYFKALSLKKRIDVTYFGIAECYYFMKKYQEAIPFFMKALQMNRTSVEIYLHLSMSYLRLNQYEESIKTASVGLKKHPKDIKMLAKVGSIYFYTVQNLGNQARELLEKYRISESKAFEFLESAYFLGNKEKDVYANLPPAYIQKAEKEENREIKTELMNMAEKISLEGLERYPEDDDLRNNLVGIYLEKGNWQDALNIEGLTKKDLVKLSLFLLNKSKFSEALKTLKMAQSKFGLDQVIEFNQAICFYHLGNEQEAIDIFRKIFKATSNPAAKYQADYFIKEWRKKRVQK